MQLDHDINNLKTDRKPRWQAKSLPKLEKYRKYKLSRGDYYRDLPPSPTLPPEGKLEKITGSLTAFESECFRAYFDSKFYRNSPESSQKMTEGQRIASGTAAIALGSPMTMDTLGFKEEPTKVAEYIQGKIDGKPFKGWVGVTRLQVGDKVELVATWQKDHYVVYAITLPAERIISITPTCEKGHIAFGWWRFKATSFLILGIFLVYPTLTFFFEAGTFLERFYNLFTPDNLFLYAMAAAGTALVFGLMGYGDYKGQRPTNCALAEEICNVLEIKEPEKVNLIQRTKARELKLYKAGFWHSPLRKNKPRCPSANYWNLENWFYY